MPADFGGIMFAWLRGALRGVTGFGSILLVD
jgi:hypothetical protein